MQPSYNPLNQPVKQPKTGGRSPNAGPAGSAWWSRARGAGGSSLAQSPRRPSCGWQRRGQQAREAGDRRRREIPVARFAGLFRLLRTVPAADAVGFLLSPASRASGVPFMNKESPFRSPWPAPLQAHSWIGKCYSAWRGRHCGGPAKRDRRHNLWYTGWNRQGARLA